MNAPTRPPAPDDVRISFTLAGSDGAILAAHEPERVFYAASTIKIAVLLAALRRVAMGDLRLDQQLSATRTFTGVDGREFTLSDDHLDEEFPEPGDPITLGYVLTVMITRSSNEATNMSIQLATLGLIAEVLADCGAHQTKVERLIGDSAAVACGLTNVTSSCDLVRLIRAATTVRESGGPSALPSELVEFAVNCLERQTMAPIGSVLSDGTRWGSKSGEIDGIRHDVAFVGEPGSNDVRYLAVCTQGLGRAAADEVITALAKALLPDCSH